MRGSGRARQAGGATRGWSLSARLVVATVLLLSVGLALAGATVVAVLRTQLIAQLDENLRDTVETIAQQDLDAIRSDDDQLVPTRYVVSVRLEGEPTHNIAHPRTSNSVGLPVLAEEAGSEPVTVRGSRPGVAWRALSLPVVTVSGTQVGSVTISTPLDEVTATIRQTGKYVILISTSLVILGATFAYVSIRHELRDLRAIERTAGAIAAGDLTRRVAPGPPGTEIGSLSSSLNTMLAHIERAFAARSASERRMRRFVADASHELRTPLATVRGYAELHRMGGVPEREMPAAMGRIEAEATRMGTLVEDLLTLARIDEARQPTLAAVDVADLARDAVRDLRALDPTRSARFLPLPGAPGPTLVRADADQLRQVFANLVGNAVRHTPAGTDVEVLVGFRPADSARGAVTTGAADAVQEPVGVPRAVGATGAPGPAGADAHGDVAGRSAARSGWAAVGRLGPPPELDGEPGLEGVREPGGEQEPDDRTEPRIVGGTSRRTSGGGTRGNPARAAAPVPVPVPAPERRLLGLLPGRTAASTVVTAPPSAPTTVDSVVVRVQDHGPGIPPEEAAKVFTRFYRIDRSRARATGGGSGLGLAIVASVAEAHGGHAQVLATPGGGTTVELTLPVAGIPDGMRTSEAPGPATM